MIASCIVKYTHRLVWEVHNSGLVSSCIGSMCRANDHELNDWTLNTDLVNAEMRYQLPSKYIKSQPRRVLSTQEDGNFLIFDVTAVPEASFLLMSMTIISLGREMNTVTTWLIMVVSMLVTFGMGLFHFPFHRFATELLYSWFARPRAG